MGGSSIDTHLSSWSTCSTFSQLLRVAEGHRAQTVDKEKGKKTNMLFCYKAWEHSVEEDMGDL